MEDEVKKGPVCTNTFPRKEKIHVSADLKTQTKRIRAYRRRAATRGNHLNLVRT